MVSETGDLILVGILNKIFLNGRVFKLRTNFKNVLQRSLPQMPGLTVYDWVSINHDLSPTLSMLHIHLILSNNIWLLVARLRLPGAIKNAVYGHFDELKEALIMFQKTRCSHVHYENQVCVMCETTVWFKRKDLKDKGNYTLGRSIKIKTFFFISLADSCIARFIRIQNWMPCSTFQNMEFKSKTILFKRLYASNRRPTA